MTNLLTTNNLRAVALMSAALLSPACGSTSGPDPMPMPGPTTIILPLRVHVLSSAASQLDATSSDSDVLTLIARVNEIWNHAAIHFELESIVREPLVDGALVPTLDAGGTVTTTQIGAALPVGSLLTSGWNLFIVRDLTSATGVPGVFFPTIAAATTSEVDPAGVGDPGRIAAHELGHSLTLAHVTCTAEGNLMAPGCASADRGRLAEAQIAAARAQAETGSPVTF
ncbi:MAG: hypothetical protein ABFS14_09710 [Gemmatimonadota bacterium]